MPALFFLSFLPACYYSPNMCKKFYILNHLYYLNQEYGHGIRFLNYTSYLKTIKHWTIMKSTSKILLGVITAAAAGAVIGMLFAPDKGNEIRSKVKRTANELADELLNAIRRGKSQYQDTKDDLRNKAYELKGKAQQKVDELAEEADDQYNATKKKLQVS